MLRGGWCAAVFAAPRQRRRGARRHLERSHRRRRRRANARRAGSGGACAAAHKFQQSAPGLTTRRCDSSQAWPQQSTLQPARRSLPRKRECRQRRTRRWPPASAPARGWPSAWCALRCLSPRECACASSRAEPPACRIQTKTKLQGVHRSAVSPAAPTKLRALWSQRRNNRMEPELSTLRSRPRLWRPHTRRLEPA